MLSRADRGVDLRLDLLDYLLSKVYLACTLAFTLWEAVGLVYADRELYLECLSVFPPVLLRLVRSGECLSVFPPLLLRFVLIGVSLLIVRLVLGRWLASIRS